MPLPNEATKKLAQVGYHLGDFTLMGLFVNPQTGEMGTYSSHEIEPGAILGFLQEAVAQMVAQMQSGVLVPAGDEDGTARKTAEVEGFGIVRKPAGGVEIVH